MKIIKQYTNFNDDDSLITQLRLKRIALFRELISTLDRPIKILDVGGTELFWKKMNFAGDSEIQVTILNLNEVETHYINLHSIAGDGRDLSCFPDNSFDIVFSNSVIEHVGDFGDQKKMADEIRRVGKCYFIQTPNRNFPIEPHFVFPFFQFFPSLVKVFLLKHFNLGNRSKISDKGKAKQVANSIRLLNRNELIDLFGDAIIVEERLWGLKYSFIVYNGFSPAYHSNKNS
jgi:hypothetical protein